MSWARGRADVEQLIADGELERVGPSGDVAVFGRLHALRRRRNRIEYPDAESPGAN